MNSKKAGKISRALIARILFATHSVVAIWRVVKVTGTAYFWLFAAIPFTIFLEGFVTIKQRYGNEYKWFCPSIFIFLCGSVPPIWFLEMKISEQMIDNITSFPNTNDDDLYVHHALLFVESEIPNETWIQLVEQTLLIILVVGRWLLPKGSITRDELSQLLLAYIAVSSDIVELFNVFKLPQVRLDMLLTIITLSMWSISLTQFPLIVTTAKGQKIRYCWSAATTDTTLSSHVIYSAVPTIVDDSLSTIDDTTTTTTTVLKVVPPPPPHDRQQRRQKSCYERVVDAGVWGIISTIVLQDGPFLGLRVYLIFWHGVINYTMIFFVLKNALIISVQLYRLVVICTDTVPVKAAAVGVGAAAAPNVGVAEEVAAATTTTMSLSSNNLTPSHNTLLNSSARSSKLQQHSNHHEHGSAETMSTLSISRCSSMRSQKSGKLGGGGGGQKEASSPMLQEKDLQFL